MRQEPLQIPESDVRKLLGAASPDAALLSLYMMSGNDIRGAGRELNQRALAMGCEAVSGKGGAV